jgi:hypothetical protein
MQYFLKNYNDKGLEGVEDPHRIKILTNNS